MTPHRDTAVFSTSIIPAQNIITYAKIIAVAVFENIILHIFVHSCYVIPGSLLSISIFKFPVDDNRQYTFLFSNLCVHTHISLYSGYF